MSHPGHIRHSHFMQSNLNELHEKHDNVYKVGNQDQDILIEKVKMLNAYSNDRLIEEYNNEVNNRFTGMSSQVLQLLALNFIMLNRFGKSPIKYKNNILNLANEESFSDDIFIDIIDDIAYSGKDIGKMLGFLDAYGREQRDHRKKEMRLLKKKKREESMKLLRYELHQSYLFEKEQGHKFGLLWKFTSLFYWLIWKIGNLPWIFQKITGLILAISSMVGLYYSSNWLESIKFSFWGVLGIIAGMIAYGTLIFLVLIGISIVLNKRGNSVL